ncbi:tetratricopeptide repeat protein [Roseibium aggregatum]|uniref:Tetratricopeptide repeat protein n=1 Tax=Roseibium aggregatum TaxID=187304 RepID=A0A939J2V4_9HYPH|nr:hypothetical protein [Roseibium aggregatum]MBN9669495.1 hypothetical protein [Roseibium aggregatum]
MSLGTGLPQAWVAEASEAAAPAGAVGAETPTGREALLARQAALLEIMLERPADLDAAFEYATVSVLAGDYEAAISTFERMLIFAPELPRVKLELGVLYYRLGSLETARYYFQSSLETPDVPPDVAAKVETYLAAIDTRQQPAQFHALLAVGARYQTNANAAPGGRQVNLNGRDFILDETATGQSDVNGFAAGRVHGAYDLGTQGDLIEADLLFFAARYADLVRLDTGLAELTLGPSFNLARYGLDDTQLGVYGIFSGVRLNHENYNGALGAGARLVMQPDIQTRIDAKFEWRYRWYHDTQDYPTVSDRTGSFLRFASTVSRQVSKAWRARVLLLADFEETRVNSDQSFELGGGVGVTYRFGSPVAQLPRPWSVDLEAGYLNRQYAEPDPLIDASESEFDHEGWVRGALTVPLRYDFSVGFTGEFRRQYSNYDLSTYSNTSAMISLTKAF